MATFVLAHLSDPHLAPLPTPTAFELMGKRIGGYINWQKHRRHFHRADVLERIVADLHGQRPDHIAVTGDLFRALDMKTMGPRLVSATRKRMNPPVGFHSRLTAKYDTSARAPET